jgi:hypothetical protein
VTVKEEKMQKNMVKKILVLGILGLLLAFGLSLAGCGIKCSNKGDCYYTNYVNPQKNISTCRKESCASYKASNVQYGVVPSAYCDC